MGHWMHAGFICIAWTLPCATAPPDSLGKHGCSILMAALSLIDQGSVALVLVLLISKQAPLTAGWLCRPWQIQKGGRLWWSVLSSLELISSWNLK